MAEKDKDSKKKSLRLITQNKVMLKSAVDIALKTKSRALFIYIDALGDIDLPDQKDLHLILVTKNKNYSYSGSVAVTDTIAVPKLKLGRLGLIKVAVLLAFSAKLVTADDHIIFLAGKSEMATLDTILSLQLNEESELLTGQSIADIPDTIQPSVFEHALNLAIELGSQGREGKPVGTVFVIGDEEKVMQLSKQMIINPFKGYEPDERNLLNPALKETIREFTSLDGAFVIAGNGEVIAAGRYLGAAMDDSEIPRGLGSRHIAAAGITALTNALAIVISESTGDVRIFRNGSVIMNIEKQSPVT
jgi:DNA integrity scanning protein DisA with diadenylate cyclase activity